MTKQQIIEELLTINENVKQKKPDDSAAEGYAMQKADETATLIKSYQTEGVPEKESIKKALNKIALIKKTESKFPVSPTASYALTTLQEIIEEFVIETQGLII